MPLIALVLVNVAIGLLAAQAAARELRASPRAVFWSRGFAAFALHQLLVAAPVTGYLLARFTDWTLSYAVVSVPSAVLALAAVAYAVAGLGGYVAGAHWLRAHHPQRALTVSVALGAAAMVGLWVLHRRVGTYGTTVEYRGGFGLTPLGASSVASACAALFALQTAALGHLLWTLRGLGPREDSA